MNEQLQKRQERLQQRIDEAESKGEFEQAAEIKIELAAVKKVLSEMVPGT